MTRALALLALACAGCAAPLAFDPPKWQKTSTSRDAMQAAAGGTLEVY